MQKPLKVTFINIKLHKLLNSPGSRERERVKSFTGMTLSLHSPCFFFSTFCGSIIVLPLSLLNFLYLTHTALLQLEGNQQELKLLQIDVGIVQEKCSSGSHSGVKQQERRYCRLQVNKYIVRGCWVGPPYAVGEIMA